MASAAPGPAPILASHADAVKAYLASIPGMAFRAPGELIQFEAGMGIDTALEAMNAAGISGAPVYDGTPFYDQITDADAAGYAASRAATGKDYVGIVDVADLAALILAKGLKRPPSKGLFGRLGDLFTLDEEHSVKSAINLHTTHRFFALPLTGNLAQAASVMAHKRVHRIAIINPEKDNHIEGMVTGTSVIRALRENLPVLGGLGTIPVGLLFPTDPERILSASATTSTAREVIDALISAGLLGLPLVDPEGGVVGNFSLSDVKSLAGLSAAEAEEALAKPAASLVKKAAHPITVTPTDTLTAVVELLASAQVHRVYIVDSARRPIGAITVTDIIKLVLSPTVTAYSPPNTEEGTPIPSAPALAAAFSSLLATEFVARDGVKIEALVDVPHDMNALGVLRTLAANNLSGVPVYTQDAEAVPDLVSFIPYAYPAQKRYIGWVDSSDLCGLVLDKGLRARREGVFGLLSSLMRDPERSSSAVINYSNNDPFWAIPCDRNMRQVIRVLGNCKVHRLAVVDLDEGNHIVGIITQSAVAKFIREHKALLGPLAALPVSSLTASSSLIKVPVTATVAEALRVLVASKITGLPVVDEGDRIVANISVTDVRHLAKVAQEDVDRVLALPVLTFLAEVKAGSPTPPSPTSLAPAVLHPSDSFGVAVDLLVTTGLHRLYVVDEMGAPTGVVTLTDIIKAVAGVL